MAGEHEKKVSRLFLNFPGVRKKPTSGRSCAKPASRINNPYILRLGLGMLVALTAVLLILPSTPSTDIKLTVGDLADRDIRADQDLMVLDRLATLEKRQTARRDSPSVYDLDDMADERAAERIHVLFSRGRAILNTHPLSSPAFHVPATALRPDQAMLDQLEDDFQANFNLAEDSKTFQALMEGEFSVELERTTISLVSEILNRGIAAERMSLLEQNPHGVTVRRLYDKSEEVVPYLDVFPSLEEARRKIMERALLYRDDLEVPQIKAIVAVAQAVISPNLTINRQETEVRRQDAVQAVAPVYFQVKRGEIIVREGERVDETGLWKLEALAKEADQVDWLSQAGGLFLVVMLFLVVTYMVGFRITRHSHVRNRDFLFLTSLLLIVLLLVFASSLVGAALDRGLSVMTSNTILYLTPVAAGGMLATTFLGAGPGIIFSIIAAALSALLLDQSLPLFLYFFLGGITGLAEVVRVRERGAVIRAGAVVGLVNVAAILSLSLLEQSLVGWGTISDLGAGMIGGVLAGILATGLLPFFEMAFKYTTDIKLLELANLDRPILRELMVQAPGTYHHSVIVGAMVEAAAEAIGANPLLAKVSAYYHDLGKMKKPLYFVENQGSGQNKHEKLAPSLSGLILISHVKDGVELARQNNLSREIIDIIQQHHGTSLIAYFYQKAKNSRTEDQPEINIEDYRYPGPKPQTREAGLVMLADAVEAASRTLAEPTPSRVQGMVQKIINNIFSDGQLDECELTLKDLHFIARTFNKILTGIFHRRIEYPESAAKESASRNKAANENQSKQSSKESGDKARTDQGSGKEDLKRLGIS